MRIIVLSLLVGCVFGAATEVQKRATAFFPPANGGGSQIDITSPGLGEPMNVIISGLSSPAVLTDAGFLNWAQSVEMSIECLGIHLGDPQQANLGDGHGALNQTVEYREDFGDADLGTCLESLIGGNHLRMWRQNGPSANSGALFLAVSHEENVEQGHTISPNGYDAGRDALVSKATSSQTSRNGVTYSATAETIVGLIQPGSNGINHGISTDGNVILLTVTIV